MSTRHYCTYFDHNYLPRAMVMLESLMQHSPQAHIHVLCLSSQCFEAMQKLNYPAVSLITLEELEAADQELCKSRADRTLIEYYFTITPCLPWYLLNTNPDMADITYLDADMIFYASPEPLHAEAQDASVIITPHRFPKHLERNKQYGLYNVSWLTFKNTKDGMACLAWYRAACIEWCKDVVEETRFADQKYLDAFPEKFRGVHILQSEGAGLAPWNIHGKALSRRNGYLHVGNEKLFFYHAHGLTRLWGPLYASGLYGYWTRLTAEMRNYILLPYIRKLRQKEQYAKRRFGINPQNSQRNYRIASAKQMLRRIRNELRGHTLLFVVWPSTNSLKSFSPEERQLV